MGRLGRIRDLILKATKMPWVEPSSKGYIMRAAASRRHWTNREQTREDRGDVFGSGDVKAEERRLDLR